MIKITHLSFSYKEKEIFHDLNAIIPDIGLTVILGRSGEGKTTLLSLLTKQLLPKEGEIKGIEEKPAIVFQSPLLLDYLTVKENVLLPLKLNGKEEEQAALTALRKTGREKRADRYPSSLSGGEARRVSLSRALVRKSRFLILDEPTGQLDEENSFLVYQTIVSLSKERGVIRVTHDEKNATKIADYLYELKGGKLLPIKEKDKIPGGEKKESKEKTAGRLSICNSLRWNFSFLKKRSFRVFLSSFFLAFNLSLLYLGRNRRKNLPGRTKARAKEYYGADVASIQEKEVIAKQGHRTLKRYSIPSKTKRKSLGISQSFPCLDYFLPAYSEVEREEEVKDVCFTPAREEKESLLAKGRKAEKYNEVIINENFLAEFGRDFSSLMGKKIPFHHQALVYSTQLKSSDRISFDFSFTIVGLSKEKKVFNLPRLYYSYPLRRDYFATIERKNISLERKRVIRLSDLLSDVNFQEDDFLSQKVLYQTASPLSDNEKAKARYEENIVISSPCRSREENRENIASSLSLILSVFLFLSLASSFLLLLRITYSLNEENKRRFALIHVFSEKKNKIVRAVGMILLFSFLTRLFTILFLFFFQKLGNFILMKLSYSSLFSFSFLSFMSILLLLFLVTAIGCYLPLRKIKEGELKSELEGEE